MSFLDRLRRIENLITLLSGATCVNKVQKLQNRAARIAAISPYDALSQPLLETLGWHTIRDLVDMETTMMLYRTIYNHVLNYLTSLFESLSQHAISFTIL